LRSYLYLVIRSYENLLLLFIHLQKKKKKKETKKKRKKKKKKKKKNIGFIYINPTPGHRIKMM